MRLMVCDNSGVYTVASADVIIAAAREVIGKKVRKGTHLAEPSKAKEFFIAKLGGLEREVFAIAFLDSQHGLIAYEEVFMGSLSTCEIHPREIAKLALKHNAAAIILSHNHPSGYPEPSTADRFLTTKLTEAMAMLGVRVLDHLVIGGDTTVSFAERGLL